MHEPVMISIVIPTFKRPAALARAVKSVLALAPFSDDVELVVVDNDAARSARSTVGELAVSAPILVRYVYEPAAGVANARNAGVRAARGDFIAFLDDDETASRYWLPRALSVQDRFGADVVFGPVIAEIPEGAPHRAYLQRFFSRQGPPKDQAIPGYYGCGGALVRKAALPDQNAPFSPERNLIGGEDDLLFGEMKRRGAKFAWAASAWVVEHPAPQRLTLRYALRRAFAYGQGPASDAWAAGPARWPMAPVWMAWGALQAIGYGAIAAARWALRKDGRAEALDGAAKGLGKLLWFPPFKIAFYGQV